MQFDRNTTIAFGLKCPHRYIVATLRWTSVGTTVLRFRVQSRKDPIFLEERVEAFLESFLEQLKAMSEEDFQIRRRGLIVKKLEKAKNLTEETDDYWDQIRSGYYNFSEGEFRGHGSRGIHTNSITAETDAAALETVTKTQMLEVYEGYLIRTGFFRRTLAVHMVSRKLEAALPLPREITEIVDMRAFKAGLDSTPGAEPIVYYCT
jgi:insulysin